MFQVRIPGIESTVTIFQTNDAWPEFVIAKLYDQLVRGVSVVGDTTMHKYLSFSTQFYNAIINLRSQYQPSKFMISACNKDPNTVGIWTAETSE